MIIVDLLNEKGISIALGDCLTSGIKHFIASI
jgi:hypothetical protein